MSLEDFTISAISLKQLMKCPDPYIFPAFLSVCPSVCLSGFVRTLPLYIMTENATFLSVWAAEGQDGNPIGSELVSIIWFYNFCQYFLPAFTCIGKPVKIDVSAILWFLKTEVRKLTVLLEFHWNYYNGSWWCIAIMVLRV